MAMAIATETHCKYRQASSPSTLQELRVDHHHAGFGNTREYRRFHNPYQHAKSQCNNQDGNLFSALDSVLIFFGSVAESLFATDSVLGLSQRKVSHQH